MYIALSRVRVDVSCDQLGKDLVLPRIAPFKRNILSKVYRRRSDVFDLSALCLSPVVFSRGLIDLGRTLDRTAAQHFISDIDNRCLARGDGPLGSIELHMDAPAG